MIASPVIFTASNPEAAHGHRYGSLLVELRGGERPDWREPDDALRVYQAEGPTEAAAAATQIDIDRAQGYLGPAAIVTGLGINPAPFVQRQIAAVFVECYAEAGLPNTSIPRMRWQARRDGWPPQVRLVPTLGVYDTWHLNLYLDFLGGGPDIPGNGGRAAFKAGHWHGGPLSIYLGEGMTDAGSWVDYDALWS